MTPTVAASIITLLKADATVAAIASTRIYPTQAPQGTESPYVVMTEVSTVAQEGQDNMLGLDETLMQFSCYAIDTQTALNLRRAVRNALCAAGVKIPAVEAVFGATLRFLPADEYFICNAILELTFSYNPTI